MRRLGSFARFSTFHQDPSLFKLLRLCKLQARWSHRGSYSFNGENYYQLHVDFSDCMCPTLFFPFFLYALVTGIYPMTLLRPIPLSLPLAHIFGPVILSAFGALSFPFCCDCPHPIGCCFAVAVNSLSSL